MGHQFQVAINGAPLLTVGLGEVGPREAHRPLAARPRLRWSRRAPGPSLGGSRKSERGEL